MTELSAREADRITWMDRANIERIEKAQAMVRPTVAQRNKHEARRAASKQCKACYYLREPRMAGQAFTAFTCAICQVTQDHHNTNVPKYCRACCDEHELCQTCGGRLLP